MERPSPPANPPPAPPAEDPTTPSAYESGGYQAEDVEDPHDDSNAHHSMPSPEEMRTEGVIGAGGAYNRESVKADFLKGRRGLVLAGFLVAALVLIAGLSASISQSNKSASGGGGGASGSASGSSGTDPEDPSLSDSRSVSRLLAVQEFLAVDITPLSTLQDLDTPQYSAALWIADEDKINDGKGMPLPSDPENYDASFPFVQRYIMAVFYFSLGGPDWPRKMNFLSSMSVCDWHIDLDEASLSEYAHAENWKYGLHCNSDGAVNRIFITDNKLTGELPVEMGDLLDLEHLSLYKNNISGRLHKEFQFWEKIKFIGLENNKISMSLPEWISEWGTLSYLALGENSLHGTLPPQFGDLTNLQELSLQYNDFVGSIDPVYQLPKLRKLYLSNNRFSGRIHDDSFQGLDHLSVIDLSRNQFTGYFPRHFYEYTEVDLHMNQLEGRLHEGLPEVTDAQYPLTFLSLYDNQMTGSLPKSLGFLGSLEHLNLSRNRFTGELTDTFDNMRHLTSLYLSENQFEAGDIPDVRDCRDLRALSLTETNRDGVIPDWLGSSLRKLILLDLHHNELTGTIPGTMGDLTNLQRLFLNRNLLRGIIPTQLANLPNLITLFLQNNELDGSLNPVCVAKPEHLAYLIADCYSEVECECCTECCLSTDVQCANNDGIMDTLNERPSRDNYLFSENIIFEDKLLLT